MCKSDSHLGQNCSNIKLARAMFSVRCLFLCWKLVHVFVLCAFAVHFPKIAVKKMMLS